eukprot:2561454-Amphidinium_carterae.3
MDTEAHGHGKENVSTPDGLKGTPNPVRGRSTMGTLKGGGVLPDRCVQGGISSVQDVVVGYFDADDYLNPGKMDTLIRTAGGLKSEQWEGEAEAQKVAVGCDVVFDADAYLNLEAAPVATA